MEVSARSQVSHSNTASSMHASRHGTPTSGFGGLGLDDSSSLSSSTSSSGTGMPAVTRAAARRAGGGGGGRQAASGASQQPTAGPSRLRRSRGEEGSFRSSRGAKAPRVEEEPQRSEDSEDDDDGDNDDGGDSGGSDDEPEPNDFANRRFNVLLEIFSLGTDSFLTPLEFGNIANAPGSEPKDRQLRQVASAVGTLITDGQALQNLRNSCPQQFCIRQTIQRFSSRTKLIISRLNENTRDRTAGRTLPEVIKDFQSEFEAVRDYLGAYNQILTADQKHTLAAVLGQIMLWLANNNRDVYEGQGGPQPNYGSASTSNPWVAFCAGQPLVFMEVLRRLPDGLLQNDVLKPALRLMWNKAAETEQNRQHRWVEALRQVHNRAYPNEQAA